MEENTDRRVELVHLEVPTITEMLEPVLAGRKVKTATPITWGRANTNYQIELEDGEKAETIWLRLYTRDQSACLKEYNLYTALHDTVPMAEVLHIETDAAKFGFPYSVLEWVDGVHLDKVITQPDNVAAAQLGQELGATLAAIGAYRFKQPGLIDENLNIVVPFSDTTYSWLTFIERCLFEGHTGTHLGADWSQQLWEYVNENVALLANLPDETSLLHADFKGSNILVKEGEKGWQVAAVLDWEFAYAGSPLADMGPLLRYDAQYNSAFEPNFAKGFQEHSGQLPDDWKRIVRLLDLLNLCDFLNRPEVSPAMQNEISQLIFDTIAD